MIGRLCAARELCRRLRDGGCVRCACTGATRVAAKSHGGAPTYTKSASKIPAGANNQELRALYLIDQDIDVVSYFPHTHLRGKDMTLTATLPDGRKQMLLSVPRCDFNWQLYYYPQVAGAVAPRDNGRSGRALR